MPYNVANPNLDKIDTRATHQLGAFYEDFQGRKFRYYKYDNGTENLTVTAGHGGVFFSNAHGVVTTDYSDANIRQAAGFAQAAFTDGTYGWWQTFGPNRKAMTTDTNVADGERLMLDASNNGQVIEVGASNEIEDIMVVAVALAADAAAVLAAGDAMIRIE